MTARLSLSIFLFFPDCEFPISSQLFNLQPLVYEFAGDFYTLNLRVKRVTVGDDEYLIIHAV